MVAQRNVRRHTRVIVNKQFLTKWWMQFLTSQHNHDNIVRDSHVRRVIILERDVYAKHFIQIDVKV